MTFLDLFISLVLFNSRICGLDEIPGRSLNTKGYDQNDGSLPTLQPLQYAGIASLLLTAY